MATRLIKHIQLGDIPIVADQRDLATGQLEVRGIVTEKYECCIRDVSTMREEGIDVFSGAGGGSVRRKTPCFENAYAKALKELMRVQRMN